jgi:hypothetical protein
MEVNYKPQLPAADGECPPPLLFRAAESVPHLQTTYPQSNHRPALPTCHLFRLLLKKYAKQFRPRTSQNVPSIARVAAGASGFFTLIQGFDGPERQGAPSSRILAPYFSIKFCFRYCPTRPHLAHARRTISVGYSLSCREPFISLAMVYRFEDQ